MPNVALTITYPSEGTPDETFEFASVTESNRSVRCDDPIIAPYGGGIQETVTILFIGERIFTVDMISENPTEFDNALYNAEEFADFVERVTDEDANYKFVWVYSEEGWSRTFTGKITNVNIRYQAETFLSKCEGITINFYRDDVT